MSLLAAVPYINVSCSYNINKSYLSRYSVRLFEAEPLHEGYYDVREQEVLSRAQPE